MPSQNTIFNFNNLKTENKPIDTKGKVEETKPPAFFGTLNPLPFGKPDLIGNLFGPKKEETETAAKNEPKK